MEESIIQRRLRNIVQQMVSKGSSHQLTRLNKMVWRRCMLFGMKIPLRFWLEAAQYAVHILNRSPTAILGNITPFEKWCQHKPSVEHLRVFGCVAYALIPYEKRVKLDEKSVKCVMFGISKESKAYRLYEPTTKKIIISKDVIFDEKKPWTWEERVEEDKFIEVVGEEEQKETNNDEGKSSNAEEGEVNRREEHEEAPTVTILQPQVAEQNSNKTAAGRVVQKPAWMKDYECSERAGLIIEEDREELIAMFVSEDDPDKFEDAVKEGKWRKAMEAEINSIEESNT